MPIPLIAAAIIGVGAITGGGGLALGGKGALDMKRARGDLEAAKKRATKPAEAQVKRASQQRTSYFVTMARSRKTRSNRSSCGSLIS
jgi:Flp pilus assembly protein TadB